MIETHFVLDQHNYLDYQKASRGIRNRECFLGDYSIEEGSSVDVRAERKAVGAASIVRLKSKTRFVFTRSWSHIREDATDAVVLSFVKRGRLCISHQRGYTVVKAGHFAIVKSMTPFSTECQTDDDLMHEALHLIVPAHVLRRFIPQDVSTGLCVPAEGREFAIAERILTGIFEDAGDVSDHVSNIFLDSALLVLSYAIKNRGFSGPVRQSLSNRRLQDVLRFIEVHLSDPKLSIATVAKACSISPRYLSLLLKLHGTPFSTLVWEKRLKIAKQWVSSSKPSEASISEIAYKVGFKSPAHFSRMFKQAYKMTPRQYRAAGVLGQLQEPALQLPATRQLPSRNS